MYVID